MVDLSPLLSGLVFVYGTAGAGLVAAILVRCWTRRGGREPTAAETTWCVFLPAIAVLIVPAVTAVQPHFIEPLAGLHGLWHRWKEAVHATALAHGALHAGNLLFVL